MRILEAKIEYNEHGAINRVIVLADFTSSDEPYHSDVRAISADDKSSWGYRQITRGCDQLNQELIENVGKFGQDVPSNDEFPGWKRKYKRGVGR